MIPKSDCTPCFCGKLIFQSTRDGGKWVHRDTGSIQCHPAESWSGEKAAPVTTGAGNRLGR